MIQEIASAVAMKYLLTKKAPNSQTAAPPNAQPNAINTLLSSIAETVNQFSPYSKNI